jgi:hypothetical protein
VIDPREYETESLPLDVCYFIVQVFPMVHVDDSGLSPDKTAILALRAWVGLRTHAYAHLDTSLHEFNFNTVRHLMMDLTREWKAHQ